MKAALKLAEAGGFHLPRLKEKLGLKTKVSQRICDELIKEGKLIRSKTGHRSVLYELPHRPKPKQAQEVVQAVTKGQAKLDPHAPVIIPPHVKVQYCPTRWA
jgi:predicted transcriptional regulator